MRITRRQFLKVSGAAAAAGATVRLSPIPAFAQSGPVKIGVLAAKAGVTAPVGESGLRGTQWAVERINAGGGILGRKVELVVEEESNPKDTVERFRKLVLQQKVDVVTGVVSTGVGLAIGPAAEEEKRLLLMWDGTTQKGVEETIPKPRYAFRSVDNEAEAVMASILAARRFKGRIKTVAGINNDYSYGRDNWAAFLAIMKKYGMNVTPVVELWPKLGETNFTSHVATLQQAKPDLVFCSFWSGDAPILLKQAHAAGLTASTKLVMTTAGGVHEQLKKAFSPEGMILGYNSLYFDDPKASPLSKEFTRWHQEKFREWPNYESDHGYFTVVEYPVLEASRRGPARSVTDLDVLAVRFSRAGHQVIRGTAHRPMGDRTFEPDPALGCPSGRPDMIVGEVKEGPARFNPATRDPHVLGIALARFRPRAKRLAL